MKTTGYGEFVISGDSAKGTRNRTTAHRAAWRYTYGEIPGGKQINHTCDVRACVNPRHLYAGTHKDNMRDMATRLRSGGHKNRRFTVEQARMIRSSPLSGAELARQLGVNQANISLLRNRKTYADVE